MCARRCGAGTRRRQPGDHAFFFGAGAMMVREYQK